MEKQEFIDNFKKDTEPKKVVKKVKKRSYKKLILSFLMTPSIVALLVYFAIPAIKLSYDSELLRIVSETYDKLPANEITAEMQTIMSLITFDKYKYLLIIFAIVWASSLLLIYSLVTKPNKEGV